MGSNFKINLNIQNEDDLYNSFDSFGKSLSEDVISYIIDKSELVGVKDKIHINLISKLHLNEEQFKNAFHNYIREQNILLEKEKRANTIKQVIMLLVGIFFIGLSILLSSISKHIILEIISTLGSFSIWESAGSWLIESKKINVKKIKLNKLSESYITISSH